MKHRQYFRLEEGDDHQETDEITVEEGSPTVESQQRRSPRERRPVERYFPSGSTVRLICKTSEPMKNRTEPKSYKTAMKLPNENEWEAACNKEIHNIMNMGVWEIVDRPTDSQVVGGRWDFKLKLNCDGSINKYKARYVAKGFTHTEGIDFNNTYAPTGCLASVRVLAAIAAAKGWNMGKMDAIAAFLNSNLTEETFLELPKGYDFERARGNVARLRKAIYGLKQLERCWSDKVKAKFSNMKMTQNPQILAYANGKLRRDARL